MSKLKYGILPANFASCYKMQHHLIQRLATILFAVPHMRCCSVTQKIGQFITKQDFEEVEEHLLRKKKNFQMDKLLIPFSDLNLVTKNLPGEEKTLSNAPTLFYSVIFDRPETENIIWDDAAIVHSVSFERAICKIQCNEVINLNHSEKTAIKEPLSSHGKSQDARGEDKLHYEHLVFKKQRVDKCIQLMCTLR